MTHMTKKPSETIVRVDPAPAGDFVGAIDIEFLIHELKDPLSVIETAVRMLLEKTDKYGPLTARQVKTLQRALRSSKKARGMLGDLLEVGRSDAGHIECCTFDPAAVVDDVLMDALESADAELWEKIQETDRIDDREVLMDRRGIRLTRSEAVHCVRLCQDETKFRQIVGNLIKNALHHRRRQIEVDLDCRGERLIVNVNDDGPVVEKGNRELIFERYTRIKTSGVVSRPGHGLGLAGARTLARHLGGDITVSTHRGIGANFCLTLPLTFAPAPAER